MSAATSKTANILIIDQNKNDTALMQEAIQGTMMSCLVHIAHEPADALQALNQNSPSLILMSAQMGDTDNTPLLKTLKTNPDFSHIPIVVLGTSTAIQDIQEQYALGANCYIVKPANFMKFKKVVGVLIDFWIGIVKLPAHE